MNVLKVDPRHALHRTLELPLAAERNLRAVLGLEMDRYTPFQAAQVYYGYAVQSRDRERGRMRVALTVVPRDKVGGGAEILQVGDVRIDLRPPRQRWKLVALAVLAVGLLAAALTLPIVFKAQALARLEEDTQHARREAALAEAARRRLEAALAEDRELAARRARRAAAIELVQEVTRLLPDGTWLHHLELAGSRVRLRGESANAADLVAALEASAVLGGAAFEGSVTRDPGAQRERFTIAATARPPAAK